MTFTWEQGHTEMAMCSDSCSAANNGVCDEGRTTAWPPEPSPGVQVGRPTLQCIQSARQAYRCLKEAGSHVSILLCTGRQHCCSRALQTCCCADSVRCPADI